MFGNQPMQPTQSSSRTSPIQPLDDSSSVQTTTATGLHPQVTQGSAPRSESFQGAPPHIDLNARSVAAVPVAGVRVNASADGAAVIYAQPGPAAVPLELMLKRCDNALVEVEALMRVPGARSEAANARIGMLTGKVTAAIRRDLPESEAVRLREAVVKVYVRELGAGCVSPALENAAMWCLKLTPEMRREEHLQQIFVAKNQRLQTLVTSIGTFQAPVGPGDLAMIVSYANWAGTHPVPEKYLAVLAQAAVRVCPSHRAADMATALIQSLGRSATIAPMTHQLDRIHEVCELVKCTDSLEGALDFYASCAARVREHYPQGDEQWVVLRHAVRYLMTYCEGEHSVPGAKEQVARLTYLLDPDGKGKGTRNVYDRSWLVALRADLRKRVTDRLASEIKRHTELTPSDAQGLAKIVDGRQRSDMLVSYQQCRVAQSVALETGLPPVIAGITAQYANSGSTFPTQFGSDISLMPEYRGSHATAPQAGKRPPPSSAGSDDKPDQKPAKRR